MCEQDWIAEVYANTQCKNYKKIKTRLALESYILFIDLLSRIIFWL